MRAKPAVVAVAVVVGALCVAPRVRADDQSGGARKPAAAAPTDAKTPAAGIQWFATWEQGQREGKRTGRPILLIAAAPQCHDISGLW